MGFNSGFKWLTGTAFHGYIHTIIFSQRFCFTEVFSQIYWFIRKGCQGLDEKHRRTGSPFIDKGRLRALCYKSWRITQLQQKAAKNNDETANTALYFKGHLFVMSGY